jgi:ABC-type Fe3+-siderophore transport system permease subunit
MGLFNDPNKIPENYGLKSAAGLIVYFLAMQVIDKHHHVELRLFNLVILSAGVFYALKKFKNTHEDHVNYFRGLIVGVATSAIASVVFGAFLFIYMKLNPDLLQSIQENEPMGHYLNEYISAFIVALEGVFSGLLVTFVLMNYVDSDEVNDPAGESN